MPEFDDRLAEALERLDRLVGSIENDPDARFRERALELLEAIDALHRMLVWRVGELAHHDHPSFFEERLLRDPVASVLFEMYGLVAPGERETNANGAQAAPVVSLAGLEASIPTPLGWYETASEEDVPEGAMVGRDVEGERILLTRIGGELHAYADACPGTPMPLSAGAAREGVLLCPWHDCRFDLRTGDRVDAEGKGLALVPLTVRDGVVRVGLRVRKRSAA